MMGHLMISYMSDESFELPVHYSNTPLSDDEKQAVRELKESEDKKLLLLDWLSRNEAVWKRSSEREAHYRRKMRRENEANLKKDDSPRD